MMRLAIALLVLLSVHFSFAQESGVGDDKVRAAVGRMLADYPQSALQDIYKSFFQERFGPGHIVADTAIAASCLRRELETMNSAGNLLYEPTGVNGAYYRVSLSVIKKGIVSFDLYFSAFLRSVREVKAVDAEMWKTEWAHIKNVIDTMPLDLPNYAEETAAIEKMLAAGHYAVHHSRLYNEHYSPHYRIIAKDIFEAELLPLIEEFYGKQ